MIVRIAFATGQLVHPIDTYSVDKYAFFGVEPYEGSSDQELLTLETEWPLVPEVRALMDLVAATHDLTVGELDPEDILDGPVNGSQWWWTAADVVEAVRSGELVFHEPEPIESWPAYVSGFREYHEKETDHKTALFARHGDALETLRQQINAMTVPDGQSLHARWSNITGSFYIEASGPASLLNEIAGIVRAAGFWWDRSSLKEEPREYVSLALYGPANEGEPAINVGFFNFSSTTCRRVKTGTKFEEVDVYEIRCD